MILYLDANEEALRKRMQKDLSRSRKSFHNNTNILVVSNSTPKEIEEWTICFLKRNNFL
jgi:hypothetical protein